MYREVQCALDVTFKKDTAAVPPRPYLYNTKLCRERNSVEFFPRARAARAPACRRKFTKIYEIPRARAAGEPCAEKVSMSEMAASARTTKGDPEIP